MSTVDDPCTPATGLRVEAEALVILATQLRSAAAVIETTLGRLYPYQIEIARATGSSAAATAYADLWGRWSNVLAGLTDRLGTAAGSMEVAAAAYVQADTTAVPPP